MTTPTPSSAPPPSPPKDGLFCCDRYSYWYLNENGAGYVVTDGKLQKEDESLSVIMREMFAVPIEFC